MKVWLFKINEPLPIDQEIKYISRMGMIANELSKRGHDLTWWTSVFSHAKKTNIAKHDISKKIKKNYKIEAVYERWTYSKNVSINRLIYNYFVAKKIEEKIKQTKKEERPDIIVVAYPTPELANIATKYAKKHQIPVVIDARDMWPDTFTIPLPIGLKQLAKVILFPYSKFIQKVFSRADTIIGITPKFVNWALDYANRDEKKWDKAFPLASMRHILSEEEQRVAKKKWDKLKVTKDKFNLIYIGTFSKVKLNLQGLCKAIKELDKKGSPANFILCGYGDALEETKEKLKNCKNTLFPGTISRSEAIELMKRANFGLAPYNNHPDYVISIPTKIIEYFSGRLPVISSLEGSTQELIEEHSCGIFWDQKNTSLSELIDKIIGKKEQEVTYAKNAGTCFEKFFSAEKVYGDLADHLERVSSA